MDAQQLAQAEVGYEAPAPAPNCGTCRFFTSRGDNGEGECLIVVGEPLPIVANGGCTMHIPRAIEAAARDNDRLPRRVALSQDIVAQASRKTIGRYPSSETLRQQQQVAERYMLKALGDGLWFAAFTNNFKDRDGEILTDAAHERYVAWAQQEGNPLPELWVWHADGSRIGQAMWVDKAGHFVYAIGRFDDTPQGKAAEAFVQQAKAGEIKLSHGFVYPDWARKDDGSIDDYRTFEISILPAGAEANPYTAIETVKEQKMDTNKRQFFKQVFGAQAESIIRQVENLEKAGKALATAGAAYKDYADYTARKRKAGKGLLRKAKAKRTKEVDVEELAALIETENPNLDDIIEYIEGVLEEEETETVSDDETAEIAVEEAEADEENKEEDYKGMYEDLIAALTALIEEFTPMQKALSVLAKDMKSMKALIEDGMPSAPSAYKSKAPAGMTPENAERARKAIAGKQKVGVGSWNDVFPGILDE